MINSRLQIAERAATDVAPAAVKEAALSRLILIASIAVGGFLRVWQINVMGYNTDEAVYAGQAAAIAGVEGLKNLFPVFRAHPLLFQFLLSVIYHFNFSDLWGRLLAAAVGMATVFMTYKVGKTLYGPVAGALAASMVAFMPYHVIVSRQLLLDGPMVFFATLTLYMLARFGKSHKPEWLYAAGVCMGLTFLSKETGIILVGAIYAFLALSPELRLRIRDLILSSVVMILVIAPFPLTLAFAGGSSTGRNYLVWQLFRRPNHDLSFYLTTVPPAIGWVVIAVAVIGLLILWRERSWREKLLVSWIIVPFLFFQVWPVKGFQYLLPIAPPMAVLAGRMLSRLMGDRPLLSLRWSGMPVISWLMTGVIVFLLVSNSWQTIQPATSAQFLAGTGGVPGGRELGTWIKANVPESARFITIGPSMGNIIQFYGRREAFGLAISPNPLHRNPSYTPLINPDLQIRRSDLQYLVWDSFSASRTPFFSDKLLSYVNKYNGRVVHTETITVLNDNGEPVVKPVIIVYEVHP
jgi:4-amino-4-deoxy-L-arabinose transferase-like glycosyltransferase